MAAFMVFIREKTLDKSELEAYWAKIRATLEGRPIKILAAYGSDAGRTGSCLADPADSRLRVGVVRAVENPVFYDGCCNSPARASHSSTSAGTAFVA
jgi:hypothetical protein